MEQANIIDPSVPSTQYIFHSLFNVKTKQEALQNESGVQRYGVRSTGFGQYDNQLFGQYIQCYIPVARMAQIFDKGYEVLLIDHADAKIVYEYIQYHLETWMQVIGSGVNQVPAPFEDLLLLDRFATSVYGVAVHQYKGPDTQTAFTRWMDQFSHLNENAFMASPTADTPALPEVKPRISLQDALLEHQSRIYR